MQSPYGRAADFFGQAYRQQSEAADYQDYEDDTVNASAATNLRLQNPTIGAVPPTLHGNSQEEADSDAFMRGFKDSMLEEARQKKRPSNGRTQLRASGGVNAAVS